MAVASRRDYRYTPAMQADIERVLITQQQIAQRVSELARQIADDYRRVAEDVDGRITIVPILTGAMIFCGDLIRHMPLRLRIGLLTVSSYPGQSITSQGSKMLSEQIGQVEGRHVLLVDDILDSGGTLRLVQPALRDMGVASLRTCVLLKKDRPEAEGVPVEYVGFDIPNEFVVGYGLDFDDYYRNVPDIVTLRRDVIEGAG